MADSDKRVKEDLSALPTRKTLGDKLLARVGRRAWERPNVAVSTRLYRYYDIQDPWDPNPHRGKWEAKLGPVSLRLGENKRQPARHLKPKESQAAKKKSVSPAKQFKPQGIPNAAKNKPAPPPAQPKPQTQLRHEFGGQQKTHKLFKMPMRPELEAQIKADQTEQSSAPESTMAQKPQIKRSRPRVVSGEEAAERSILRPKSVDQNQRPNRFAMKRTQTKSAPKIKGNHSRPVNANEPVGDQQTHTMPPISSNESQTTKAKNDTPKRFSMSRKQTTQKRSIKTIETPKETPKEAHVESTPPQRPPKPVDSFSLDDLFGAGGSDSGPIRMKRRQSPPKSDPK